MLLCTVLQKDFWGALARATPVASGEDSRTGRRRQVNRSATAAESPASPAGSCGAKWPFGFCANEAGKPSRGQPLGAGGLARGSHGLGQGSLHQRETVAAGGRRGNERLGPAEGNRRCPAAPPRGRGDVLLFDVRSHTWTGVASLRERGHEMPSTRVCVVRSLKGPGLALVGVSFSYPPIPHFHPS